MAQQITTPGDVRIHIDDRPFDLPSCTTGASLYSLCSFDDEDFELYREGDDDQDDFAIPNDDSEIQVAADSRFRTGRCRDRIFRIIVNAERRKVSKRVLTFDEVVRLAFPDPPSGPYIVFTVTFKKAAGPTNSGSLLPGDSVKIKNGTIFSVTVTDKS